MPNPVPGGRIVGRPYQGSHTRGNWQSDNAVDIAVPKGTPVYAVTSGVIGPNIGSFHSSDSALAGLRLTLLEGNGDASYYAHLSRLTVHAGQRVNAGQLLGYSGEANGLAHLHFAVEKGSPFKWLAGLPSKVAAGVGLPSEVGASAAVGDASGLGCATMLLEAVLIVGALTSIVYAAGAPFPW
jgi:murein DD-endopeptidase MepM/ murein hydrolase activator NlpD